jgi:hypothetical protein
MPRSPYGSPPLDEKVFEDQASRFGIPVAGTLTADIQSGEVNLSAVVKRLLLAWYADRERTGELVMPGVQGMTWLGTVVEPHRERLDDPLVQKLLNHSFE